MLSSSSEAKETKRPIRRTSVQVVLRAVYGHCRLCEVPQAAEAPNTDSYFLNHSSCRLVSFLQLYVLLRQGQFEHTGYVTQRLLQY